MKLMSLIFPIAFTFAASSESASAFNGDRVEFDGTFTNIVSTSSACDDVFADADYHSRFILTGPTRRTLVSNFSSPNEAGFLHNQTFVSLFGYNGDFLYEKTIKHDAASYKVNAYGFVDLNVVYIEFKVEREDAGCTVEAVYSGFN